MASFVHTGRYIWFCLFLSAQLYDGVYPSGWLEGSIRCITGTAQQVFSRPAFASVFLTIHPQWLFMRT